MTPRASGSNTIPGKTNSTNRSKETASAPSSKLASTIRRRRISRYRRYSKCQRFQVSASSMKILNK